MATGVRQDSRRIDQGLRELEKRIERIESAKYPTQIGIRAKDAYSQADLNAVIDKLNELLRLLNA